MAYWQVAAGQGARDYSNVFLKFGVMFIGSGNPGSYFDDRDFYKSRKWGHKIVHFAERVSQEDFVVLKRPHHSRWQIQAVGRVTGDYEYLEQFADVEGWDLRHCRRVEWKCPQPQKVELTNGLSRGTFIRMRNQQAIENATRVWGEGIKLEAEKIPPPARNVSDEDLVESLIGNGLRPADAETVIQTIWRVRRLALWYEQYGRHLSEHEIRTFLIVPIMLALGWSEQKIKIEWKNTDMSFFSQIYKKGEPPQTPHMILESKRIYEGLDYAERQLMRYARNFPDCQRLMASDGIRYQLYIKQDDKWNLRQDLQSYMNLLRLKDRHPYLVDIGGAPDLCINLMPN